MIATIVCPETAPSLSSETEAGRTRPHEQDSEKLDLILEAMAYRFGRFIENPSADNFALLRCNLLAYQEAVRG